MGNIREQLQKKLGKKIYKELQEFKKGMLQEKNGTIIENAYAIVCMINIYEEVLELISQMNIETLNALLGTPDVLKFFYSGWLEVEDSFQDELRNSIISQIPIVREYERRKRLGYEKISSYS